jgi:hypothetical protein
MQYLLLHSPLPRPQHQRSTLRLSPRELRGRGRRAGIELDGRQLAHLVLVNVGWQRALLRQRLAKELDPVHEELQVARPGSGRASEEPDVRLDESTVPPPRCRSIRTPGSWPRSTSLNRDAGRRSSISRSRKRPPVLFVRLCSKVDNFPRSGACPSTRTPSSVVAAARGSDPPADATSWTSRVIPER